MDAAPPRTALTHLPVKVSLGDTVDPGCCSRKIQEYGALWLSSRVSKLYTGHGSGSKAVKIHPFRGRKGRKAKVQLIQMKQASHFE